MVRFLVILLCSKILVRDKVVFFICMYIDIIEYIEVERGNVLLWWLVDFDYLINVCINLNVGIYCLIFDIVMNL